MSEQNVIEVIVVPEVPKVVSDEEIYVYVPIATNDTKGIASFDKNSINIVAGVASVNDNYVNELIDIKVQTADNEIKALVTAEAATRQQKDEELQKNIDDVPFFVGTDGYIYGKD